MELSKVQNKIASTVGVSELKINHKIKFRSLVRDQYVYKNV